jgi:ParB family chromosome partitioning protein
MPEESKRLGRGLSSAFSALQEHTPQRMRSLTDLAAGPATQPARQIPTELIDPNPFQPRQHVDPQTLAALAESLRHCGILQPLVVRPRGDRFELVLGHRRWQAARQAALPELPAIVRHASDEQMLELALVENIHREDLNALDRATAYRQYRERFGLTAEQIAQRVGEDRTTVTNYLRLLELPEPVRAMLADGSLAMGPARALLGLEAPEEQIRFARRIIAESLSTRHVERLIQQRRSSTPLAAPRPKRPLIQDLEERFEAALGAKVQVFESRKKNTGRVVIHYASLDDFDRIAQRLGIELSES